MTKPISIEKKYQKKTLKEHIETRPGNYIGTIELCTQNLWVLNDDKSKMIQKDITYSPGLMKIIDEIIVNAYDQSVRLLSSTVKKDKKVTEINICYDKETGEISVYNNGNGIDVAIHPEHNVYVPELIFGHLLTSTNYDDEEEKITGGKNGYGAKLSNIFSTYFEIETVDYVRHMKFKQVYRDNMNKKDKSVVTKARDQPYTKITFIPDFERFDLENITDDIERLIIKRVYDLAACTNKLVNVKLNNEKLNCQTFEQYVNLYIGNEVVRVYEKINDRWEVAACMSLDDKFEQISFVNGINTTLGGKHVDYVAGNISKQLVEYINTKKKKLNVKSAYIKENLWVFINSTIVNPDFDSQTKTNLTTNITKFGSKCIINDKFIEKLSKCGIMDRAIALAEYKENNTLKQNDGTKRSTIRGIPKLDDANYAGTSKSKDCTLILTEGDSAKAFAVAGLSVIGRNYYGVFPLKGKILNVRDCIPAKILSNVEITYLKQIIGLRQNKIYTDTNGLRYGHIMILTDADVDGSHIKGLFMNMIEHFWPSLIQITGFIQSMVTPVVKVKKGKNITSFYTLTEYNDWKNETNNGKGYDIKYYKGLGTSTSNEAKEYFGDLKNNQVDYIWEDNSKESILLAFSKNYIDKRKDWLQTYNKNAIVEATERTVEYSKFIHNDLKHFSNYDNIRSIPSMIDGLKPSQRKILYSGLLKNLINEIKVAQFAGYVSEKSSYHHGEMSLTGTIVGMAQNFVGSNNINLFNPNGMFGTRIEGGKDASSPRYIFTNLNALTLLLFNKKDEALLNYLNDDGTKIEPEWYVPIIPQILVNGSEGIGTGYSTYIPKYNPKELIQSIKSLLNGEVINDLDPWYQNFKGTITKIDDETYVSKGKYEIINSKTVEITELPVGIWTSNYKDFLDTITVDATDKTNKKKYLSNWKYGDNYTEASVHFILTFSGMGLTELISDLDRFEKTFKLQSRIKISNMHLYNRNNEIHKYSNTTEIIEEFYDIRLEYYTKRRNHLIKQLEDELLILNIKVQFISDVINEKIIIFKKKHAEIVEQLKKNKYPIIKKGEGYDYLIKMQIYLFTEEKVNELEKQRDSKEEELNRLTNKTEKDLWLEDLEELETKYNLFVKKQVIKPNIVKGKGKGKKKLVVKKSDEGTSKKTIVGRKLKVIKK